MKKLVILPFSIVLGMSAAFADTLPAPAPAPVRQNQTGSAPATPALPAIPVQPATKARPGGPLPAGASTGDDTVVIVVPGGEASQSGIHGAGVGGVNIGGLSDVAAYLRLKTILGPQLGVAVNVNDGRKIWTVTRAALGLTIPYRKLMDEAHQAQSNVPLRFELDMTRARVALTALAGRVETFPTTDHTQAKVNIGASLYRIRYVLEAQHPGPSIELSVTRLAQATPVPVAGKPTASPDARFPYLLSEFSSPFDPGIRGRSKNLRMAARNVDGTIVADGSVFSANKAIGPRDEADGWREAKMFVDGQVVSGIGAGICQCSSTIYNAALLAGFKIIERHPHMFRVMYVPVSRDATIYWGQKDMRFRNTSGGPILIKTSVSHNHLHVAIWGIAPVTSKIKVTSHVTSRKGGIHSVSYREITDATGTHTERLSRDFYKPHPKG